MFTVEKYGFLLMGRSTTMGGFRFANVDVQKLLVFVRRGGQRQWGVFEFHMSCLLLRFDVVFASPCKLTLAFAHRNRQPHLMTRSGF